MASRTQVASWRTRTTLYLRISPSCVLQMLVCGSRIASALSSPSYLDPRHTDWMSGRILESVLAELKGRIRIKLQKEDRGGKAQVDIFRSVQSSRRRG